MKKYLVLSLFVAMLVFANLGSFAYAADINARIRGTVVDPTGASIPNVTVTATNEATGVKFTVKSQANGDYFFAQLPIGTYTVTAATPGFTSFVAKGIVLNIDQEYVEPVKMSVGSESTQIEVAADQVQVNTTDMQFDNIVTSAQMVELPLIGRSFTNLELIQPGVQAPDNRFGTFSVSGAQSQQSEYIINGADTNDIALNTIVFQPVLDAIDQFNLISGPLNAEYDRNSGGIVSATIKQGTNHFHGDIFEFYRDTFMNTNNYFAKTFDPITGKRTDTVSPYHQNIYGGTIGGPVLKDKLFFFGAYEGRRQAIPQYTSNKVNVFTAAELSGDFSSDLNGTGAVSLPGNTFSSNPIPATVTVPGCTAPGETWATCLASGTLSPTAFNPTALALVNKYVPKPNPGGYVYSFNSTVSTSVDQYIGRVDYNFSSHDQITVVGIHDKVNAVETLPFTGANVPGFGDEDLENIQQWTLDYVHQINSSTVNDLAAHYTRFNYKSGTPQQVVQPSSLGFAIAPQDGANASVPNIAVDGYFTLGGATSGPQPRIDQSIQFDDSLSKQWGHHQIKVGYDGRRFNVWNIFDASNSGAYAFTPNTSRYGTGDAGLDFLLGIPAEYTQGTGSTLQVDAFLNYIYAQDNWKVSNTLTIDYGLGYSIDTPMRDHQYGGEGIACFIIGEHSKVFSSAPTNLVFPGDPGCTNSGQAVMHHDEFGPRFGFAWAPDLGWLSGTPGKFSVRGGFGIYYNRTEEEPQLETLGTPPFGITSNGASDVNGSPQFANPFADINNTAGESEANRFPYAQPTPGSAPTFTSPILEISGTAPSFRAPYAENFQLSIERELPSNLIARVSYVGSLAHRNQTTYEANPETAAGHANCLANSNCYSGSNPDFQNQLFPGNRLAGAGSGAVEQGLVGSEGSSNYNALQVSLTKNPSHGFQFQLSYTFSHALDNGSGFENSGFGSGGTTGSSRGYNQYDESLNYGNSTYDIRHNLVFAPVYITPIIGGRALSPMSLALSGWEISGIMQAHTGQPYDISYGGFGSSNSLYCSIYNDFYACGDVPEQTAPLSKYNTHTRNGGVTGDGNLNYFRDTSFASEILGQFGNIGRNKYSGPGYFNTNVVLAKNFFISNSGVMRLQLRLESDNVFNNTQLENPDGDYVDQGITFGEITGAAASRITQIGGKFYF